MRKIIYVLELLLYIFIQVLFIPFAIIGLILGLYKEMYLSKKYGVSFSAGQALQYRWMMHMFDTRHDPLSISFTKKFPCESHLGLLLTLGPLIFMHKVFRFPSTMNKLVKPGYETLDKIAGNRVLKFDEIIDTYSKEVDQIVLPGAGFDLITHRIKDNNIKIYELDQTKTINMKKQTLTKANIKHDHITYIPVNYEEESWADKLVENGFDKNKKTLFLWQSVSLYLDKDTVIESLTMMRELSSKGSIIAQDFYAEAFLNGSLSKIAVKNMDMIAKQGEPWKFSLDMSNNPKHVVESFLNKVKLPLTEYTQFGEKIQIEPFYCIVTSKI